MYSPKHRAADCQQDILDNIARIEEYTAGYDSDGIKADRLRHDTLERCVERICEAAYRLADRAAVLMPDRPWGEIRGLENRMHHRYDQLNFAVVWQVVRDELPRLKADAYIALERLQSEDPA